MSSLDNNEQEVLSDLGVVHYTRDFVFNKQFVIHFRSRLASRNH